MHLGQVPLESFISVQGVQTKMPLDKTGQTIRATGVMPKLGQGFKVKLSPKCNLGFFFFVNVYESDLGVKA